MIVDRGVGGGKFLQSFYSLNLTIAPSRRRNGWCELSALLLSHRPQRRRSSTPMTFIAVHSQENKGLFIAFSPRYPLPIFTPCPVHFRSYKLVLATLHLFSFP